MKNTDKVLSDLVERHPDIGEAMSLNLNNIKLYAGDVLTDGTSVGRAGGGEISITAGKYAPLGVDLMILPPDNWVLRRDSFAGVLTHEMGHIVHNYVAQGAVEDGLVPTIGAFNGLLDRIAPTLSIYAQTNANEAAAEFFVLWSSKTRNTASALMRIDDWYRRYATIRRPLKVPLIASSEVYATIPPLPKDKYVEAMLKLYHIYNRILGRS